MPISFEIPEDMKQDLDLIAKNEIRSRSSLIKLAIKKFLENYKNENKK